MKGVLLNAMPAEFPCKANECLTWILVLIGFLSIFFLAYSLCYKMNSITRMIGIIWSVIATVSSVIVVAFHPCWFTLFACLFVGLMIFAVIYNSINEKTNKLSQKIDTKKQEIIQEEKKDENELAYPEVDESELTEIEKYINSLMQNVQQVEIVPKEVIVEESLVDEQPVIKEEVVVQQPTNVIEEQPIEVKLEENTPDTYIIENGSGKTIAVDENLEPIKAEEEKKTEELINVVTGGNVKPTIKIQESKPETEPIKNKFTDIVVSQIQAQPENQRVERSREELIREIENRPVMIKYQQVNFNSKKEAPVKAKVEKKVQEEPKVTEQKSSRGYQINKIVTD